MTLLERAAAFNRTFAKWPASHLRVVEEQSLPVLYGRWLIGNNYRNRSTYYGAYPAGYLDRVMAVFPDVQARQHEELAQAVGRPALAGTHSAVLHVFSGSLPPGPYERCDLVQPAELSCSVYDLPNVILNWQPWLVIADPPYTSADAKQYGTPGINRRRATAALARVTPPGGHLVWLDTCWPMHRKAEWRTVGRITLLRSTNHRVREITIFERAA